MSRGPDAGTLLRRALEADAMRAGCAVTVASIDWTRWSSATFTGARHEMVLAAAESAALDQWLAALPEAEFDLRGHVLADITLINVRRADVRTVVVVEALTVES